MKKLSFFTFLLLAALCCSCSKTKPILEGPVKFVIYEPEPGDIRRVYVDKAPIDFKRDPNAPFANLWDCAPYVKLYPDYVELDYHFKKQDGSSDDFTHVFPSSRLRFLRWLNKK